jgi:hypothetical protein
MRHILTTAVLLVVASGCSDRAGKAVIDDYPGGGGYKIVSIDGTPLERASSAIATMVPYILAKPGTHAFKATTLQGAEQFAFNATVNADRKYRVVAAAGGNLALTDVTPPVNSN